MRTALITLLKRRPLIIVVEMEQITREVTDWISNPAEIGNGVAVGTEDADEYFIELTSMVNTFLNYFDAACATLGQQPTTGTYFSGDSVGEDPNRNNPNSFTPDGIATPTTTRGGQGGTGATNSDVTFISVGSVTGDTFGKKRR